MTNIIKSEAFIALEKMSLNDPSRNRYVDIIGYDPNEKWSGPLGEHSFALSEMMRKKGIKPKF